MKIDAINMYLTFIAETNKLYLSQNSIVIFITEIDSYIYHLSEGTIN